MRSCQGELDVLRLAWAFICDPTQFVLTGYVFTRFAQSCLSISLITYETHILHLLRSIQCVPNMSRLQPFVLVDILNSEIFVKVLIS